MKKLVKMFKSLPPEIRTLLALAGLASPIGAIYFIKRFFPGISTLTIIFCIIGIALVLGLLALIISKIFGRGGKKRSKKMESELTGDDASGRASVDVRAQIKANNDKFSAAVREMKRTFETSVYDLPWYIVMGDSGCGKTRLVNNGGLTFAAGKPEGYQLGTLNYNWWFTEDAVFIDMAGRLCNPQEDADHREWEGFLDTVARGRKGFPINGAVLCISADHLLEDSPERHEADANTALERLRDLQNKLGVTFATYLVITKCDKILGFMQFFDRAERDITVKNQIFGYSKTGAFNELYNPEDFGGHFEELYGRLNELRTRRLNDEANEIDLGFAYSFPEEFRELCDPLQTYIRTLFPPIKNPRGIKNLIFRGVYFTSATQEGAILLKHLRDRLGAEAADQLPTLDSLYPEKRPLFVKELFFKKMFPEQGLVFRNEKDIVRNRKLAKILKFGSTVLAILLIAVVTWSYLKLDELIAKPRDHALHAADTAAEPAAALKAGTQLGKDIEILRQNRLYTTILSVGFGASRPITDLTSIRARLFEHAVLEPVLGDVDKALRQGIHTLEGRGRLDPQTAGDKYLKALVNYVAWFGCSGDETLSKNLDYESFKAMSGIVSDPESLVIMYRDRFKTESNSYFSAVRARDDWKNPARLMMQAGRNPEETINIALAQAHGYFKTRYASLNEDSPFPAIQEWMRIQKHCATIEGRYEGMVEADTGDLQTTEEVARFSADFVESFGAFNTSLEAVKWKSGDADAFEKIPTLITAILDQRKIWLDYDKKLLDAYSSCGVHSDEDARAFIAQLGTGSVSLSLVGLDQILWENLQALGLTSYGYSADYFEDEQKFASVVDEVHEAFGHIITLAKGEGTNADSIQLTSDCTHVQSILAGIREQLPDGTGSAGSTGGRLGVWIDALWNEVELSEEDPEVPAVREDLDAEKWRRESLVDLAMDVGWVIRRHEGRKILDQIATRLERDQLGSWGIAELYDGWRDARESQFSMPIPSERRDADRAKEAARDKRSKPAKKSRRRRRRSRDDRSEASTRRVEPRARRATRDRTASIPSSAHPDFVREAGLDTIDLLDVLHEFDRDLYLSSEEVSVPLNEQCYTKVLEAWEVYAGRYAAEWNAAYKDASLLELKKLEDWREGWKAFAGQFRSDQRKSGVDPRVVRDEFEAYLAEVLQATRWVTYIPGEGYWSQLDSEKRNEAEEVQRALDSALSDHFGSDSFAFGATDVAVRSTQSLPPWDELASRFGDLWEDLATGITDNTDLAREFERRTSRRTTLPRIPWRAIQKLRKDTRLDNETSLTGQLVEFELEAQQLLNVELTEILCGIQEEYFQLKRPPDGWPYLGKRGERGRLETVEFEQFKSFLGAIKDARKLFEKLDDGLIDDEVSRARAKFYNRTMAWFEFLSLGSGSDGAFIAEPLEIVIRGGDPKSDPIFKTKLDDTAQHYYGAWELTLGVELKREDGGAGGALRTATDVEEKMQPRKATWDFEKHTGDRDVVASLVDALPGKEVASASGQGGPSLLLGRSSPLAFCGYLHGYGYRDGQVWKTMVTFDLGRLNDPNAKTLGEMLVFEPGRPMPDPIAKLERAPRSAHGSRSRRTR